MTLFKANRYPAQPLAYNANAAQQADLIQQVLTSSIQLRLSGTFQIAAGGGVSGAVRPEAVLRLMRWIRVTENGVPLLEWDPRALVQLHNRESEHPATIIGPTTGDVQGPSPFSADFAISFTPRILANPFETVYRPVDPTKKFQLEVEWEPTPAAVMFTAAFNRVLTFPTPPVLEVTQHFDAKSGQPPIYLPRLRRINSGNINGATLDFPLDLKMSARSRGLLIHTLGDGETNGGIITGNVSLEGKDVYYKRLNPVMMHEEELRLYPAVDNTPGYFFVNFAQMGRLANIFDPAQDGQLQLKADVAAGGAAVGIIRVYDLQLVGQNGVTRILPNNHPLR